MAERQRDERTYIKVHDGIEDHPKVAPVSDKAFRLLLTTWGWCSRHLTDGRVPLAVWHQRGTAKTRTELVRAELAEVYDDHVLMHDYLEHQRSAADVAEIKDAKRRAGQGGNHKRWHTDRGVYDPDCELCVADATDPRSHTESQRRSQNGRKTSPETETETETEIPLVTSGGDRPEADAQARATKPPQRPPERCTQHADTDADPGPCRGCAKARQRAETFDRDTERARIAAIRACGWCDTDGWRIDPANRHRGPLGVRCDHTPLTDEQLAELAS